MADESALGGRDALAGVENVLRSRDHDEKTSEAVATASMRCATPAQTPKRLHADKVGDASHSTGLHLTSMYSRKRQERDELAEQVRRLDEQLESLRRRVGLPTKKDRAAIDDVEDLNAELDEALHVNHQFIGRLHSMVTNELLLPSVNPMSTFIHLPCDLAQRRAILRGMQELKLRRGVDVVTQRLYHLDSCVPYLSEARFTTASGEYHVHRLEINQFPNFKTAKQLFDVFVQFLYHMEISITEDLGQLTLREDTDEIAGPTIWNHRIVTVAESVGCTEELNNVGFARFYHHSPATNSPMGIVVYDTVNVDDLYPYVPEQRSCKDVQAAHMVCEVRPHDSDQVVVVLKQCLFCVQLVPQFELAPEKLQQLHANSTRWCAYMIKYLREYVAVD